ncbi:MAG: PAS domain S-box protein, partial [Candidatus Competibacteraceae bacterium]|nr:PAS domain S-box protein [Candidatus Competibacteraceae bacterium]
MAEHASTSEILRSPIINTWLLLLALTGAVVSALYYAHSLNNLVITENKRENTLVLARELRQTSDDLTRMVRTYIVTGNSIYKRHFQEILDIRDGKAPRPVGLGRVYWDLVGPDDRRPRPSGPPAALLDLMRESGIMASEFAILQRSKEASDLLTRTEFAAMALVESDPSPAARLRAIQMLTDRAYHQAKAVIMSGIATFEEQISQRTLNNLEKAETTREYAIGLLAVTCVLSVFLLWRQLYSLNLERRLYQMGQSLLESEERFHLMTDEIKDYAIILLDLEGRVTSWNTGAERIKGYTDQEILGQSMTVFYPQEGVLSGKPHTLLQQAKDEGQAKDTGWRVRKDGSRFYADVTITAVHDRSGKFIGFAKITHDITESRQAQQELLAAKEAAEAASRAKSEFLANMSHEVRTPMNGVIGMSEVLLNTRLTDEQRRMMQVIRDSAQAQLGILNDILDFSKIEAGKLSFSIEPFVFADLVEKTCAALAEPARQKRVALRHDVDADIPRALEGDALRVRQILANFLSNAIKFSSGLERTGEVEVMARLANEGSGQVWVELAVRDNGIGMDTATLARVFQPFTQADASTTRQYGG